MKPARWTRNSDSTRVRQRVTKGIEELYAKIDLPAPLSRSEEHDLIRRWQELGDIEARDKIVVHNIRFALTVAAEFSKSRGEDIDLAQEAAIGLCIAADKFDTNTGYKFITYAVWWIRQRLQRHIDEHGRHIRVPIYKARMARDIKAAEERIAASGRLPSVQEVADLLGANHADVMDVMGADCQPLSLSTPTRAGANDDLTVGDSIAWDGPAPDEDLYCQEVIEVIRAALNELGQLDARMALIINEVFGLNGGAPKTLDAVGIRLGMSRERVRQLRNKALAMLAATKHGEKISQLKGAA